MGRDDRVAQLRKGVLELAILAILEGGELYAVQLVDRLAARPGLAATAGTVYPLLARLDKAGLVRTRWGESPAGGPPRKYYRLTERGVATLRDSAASWHQLKRAVDELLEETR